MLNHLSNKKNVLLILTDQQRYDAVGYINPQINTPNINKLASESVNCTTAVVQSPQCQPSRAALLTSRYPTTLKMWWNDLPLDPRERTIANILRGAGYDTGYFGKMHVDGDGCHTSTARHFGFYDTFLYEDWRELITSEHADVQQRDTRIRDEFFHIMADSDKAHENWGRFQGPWVGKLSSRELHHEDVITNKAIKFINKDRAKPYFCVVGFHGPHPPYAAPPPFNTMYDPKSFAVPEIMRKTHFGFKMTPDYWRGLKSQYFGIVSWIDDNIGRILQHVGDDTVVIYTSDHGDILGDHGYFSKGLFAYDGNVRVPLLMKFPLTEPATYTHIVQAVDVLPTVLEAVGVKYSKGLQGRSLYKRLWKNRKLNEWAFSCIGANQRLRMIRTPEFKYWWYNGETLFDLRKDPSESRNIASAREDILARMRELMIQVLIETEDPLPPVRAALRCRGH